MIAVPMTRPQFESQSRTLQEKHGIALDGDTGTISRMGVTARYSFDGSMLRVEVLDKPFFVTEAYCEEQLRAFLGQ